MKKSVGDRIFDIINGGILILLAIVTLYPVLYVVFASLSEAALLEVNQGLLFKPLGFNLNAYKAVLADAQVWTGYKNTIDTLIKTVLDRI